MRGSREQRKGQIFHVKSLPLLLSRCEDRLVILKCNPERFDWRCGRKLVDPAYHLVVGGFHTHRLEST